MQIKPIPQDQSPHRMLDSKTLRAVLKDWDLLKVLGEHYLAEWNIVKDRQQATGYTLTPAGRGLALREVLQAALETLKPDTGPPQPQEKRWRPYLILVEQYIHGRNPDWVQQQLHVSKGTYYYEQERALEILVSVLQRWEEEYSGHAHLNHPDRLTRSTAIPSTPFMAPPRPSQALVGREQLFNEIKRRLLNNDDRGLIALNGLPGAGKSTLAIELAHDPAVLDHFRDGVVWAGLGRQPDVLALLGTWAAVLGVAAEVIANRASIAELAALVHTAIGLRRMLLIVDDVWQVETMLAFKVGGPNCAQLVTTRLPEVAHSIVGDKIINVPELNDDAGLSLMAQLSPHAVERAPVEARALVRSVGGLPLALILMGRYLQKQSYNAQSRRLHEALTNLQTSTTRLHLTMPNPPLDTHPDLPPGTPLSLQFVIGLSDAALDPATHQALIDLSVFAPKPNSFAEEAALAVTVAPPKVLDQLVERGLLEPIDPDRYTLHQTIADYAALHRTDQRAFERLVSYFANFVEAQANHYPALDAELGNLLPLVGLALKIDRRAEAIRLINALYPFLEMRGLYQQSEQFLGQGRAATEVIGDQVSQAVFLEKIGDLAVRRGQFGAAQNYLRQSIDLAQATQLRRLEGYAKFSLGLACLYTGDAADIRDGPIFLEQALQLARETNDRENEALALDALGYAYEDLCDYPRAIHYLEQALPVCHESGNRRAVGWAHFNIGTVELAVGNFTSARFHFEQCLHNYQAIGDRRGEGWLIYEFGRLYRQLGQYRKARATFEEAQQILSDIGDLMGQGFSIHNLGLLDSESNDRTAALDRFEQARAIFGRIGCIKGEAQTYYSQGGLYRRSGEYEAARPLLEQALRLRRQTKHARGESKALADLGLVLLHLGEDQIAVEYGQQAVQLAEQIGARPTFAYNLMLLGNMWADLERWPEAARTYQHAVDVRRELGQPHLLLEPLAGLAQARLNQGEVIPAKKMMDEVWDCLAAQMTDQGQTRGWVGADNPERFYLTCQRVLNALHDQRAEIIAKIV